MYNIIQYDISLLVIFPVSQDSDIEETGEWGLAEYIGVVFGRR
jgi:hypothetical protein